MKNIRNGIYAMLALLVFTGFTTFTQAPRFKKVPVSDSGCSIYIPGDPGPVDLSYSPDSSKVYTIETLDSTYNAYFHMGAIVVRLKDMTMKPEESEDMVISYLDYLKTAFNIKKAAGYGKGHTLTTHPTAKGVIDYWEDADGDQWAVKGWAAESTMFIMFIYGPKEFPNYNVQSVFFEGARFPGDK